MIGETQNPDTQADNKLLDDAMFEVQSQPRGYLAKQILHLAHPEGFSEDISDQDLNTMIQEVAVRCQTDPVLVEQITNAYTLRSGKN